MELKNWKSYLFVKDGSEPTYLPEVFRLPNGDTRKAENCSLEDIKEAGFIGPVESPPLVPSDKNLIWDSTTLTWRLEPCVIATDTDFIHKEIIQYITSELSLCGCHKNGEELSPASKRKMWEYQGKLREILEQTEINNLELTWDVIPEKIDLDLVTLSEAKNKVFTYLNSYPSVKEFYELYGLILISPELEVELISDLPETWVAGSSPLPENIFKENYYVPSGYVISDLEFAEHKYYYVEPQKDYEQKVSAKLQLRLEKLNSDSTEI